MLGRQIYLDEIINFLYQLERRIKEKNKLNLQDENIFSENILSNILNIIYKIKTVNANKEKSNFEGIDLIDKENKIVIQISATSTIQKINDTLNKSCMKKYHEENYNLKFIFLDGAKKLSKKIFSNKFNIRFNPEEDIIDFSILIKKIQELDNIKEIEKIFNYLNKELLSGNKITVKKASILSEIVNILSEKNFNNKYNSNLEKDFKINEKIDFNSLNVSKKTIEDFAPHCSYLNSIYEEYDKNGNNKSMACFNFIHQEYCKILLKISNADKIFFQLIEQIYKHVINYKKYEDLYIEEVKNSITIIIVDAFLRCKIYKNPNKGINKYNDN